MKKLLRTKELWMCALIIGISQLVQTGIMSQLVVRNTGIGLAQNQAVSLMTVGALIGLAGSYCWGLIDQKYGVKKAMLAYFVFYCVAIIINCTDTIPGVYISTVMIGISAGAGGNFIVSLPTSVFGRHEFATVNSVYFPLMEIVLMMNYLVNAFALKVTGSLRGAYLIYIGLIIVDIILISITQVRKYNKDYQAEERLIESSDAEKCGRNK